PRAGRDRGRDHRRREPPRREGHGPGHARGGDAHDRDPDRMLAEGPAELGAADRDRRRDRGRGRARPVEAGTGNRGEDLRPTAMKRTVLMGLTAVLGLTGLNSDAGLPVRIETGVGTQTRDGVKLVSDVYRPDADGRYPTVVQRTPYDRKDETMDAMPLAAAGYAVVVQDTRGRFGSDGEFYPFRHEAADGYDTIEWAAAQPWSNGKVGMFGGSYVGATQMLAA